MSPLVSSIYTDLRLQIHDHFILSGVSYGNPASLQKILCLHGWMDNCMSFQCLAPFMADLGFHVVALDLPGHGKSSFLDRNSFYTNESYSISIIRALYALHWLHYDDQKQNCEIHFLSHSFGSAISVSVAGMLGKKIKSLFLIEGGLMYSFPVTDYAHNLEKVLRDEKVLLELPRKVHKSMEEMAASRIKRTIGGWNPSRDVKTALICLERNVKQVEGGYQYTFDIRARGMPWRLNNREFVEHIMQLASNNCKIAIALASPNESIVDSNDKNPLRHIKKIFNKAKFIECKGSHHFHLENFEQLLPHLKEFFQHPVNSKL